MAKSLEMVFQNKVYHRIPVKTDLIRNGDDLSEVIRKFALPQLKSGDTLFISEKAVAVTQNRAYPVKDIRPGKLAVFLSGFVTKTPAGIGLGIPETMEMALKECGAVRILFAAAISAAGKLIGRKGDFYRIAGPKASAIDGPTANTIPPYNEYVVLGPSEPDRVAEECANIAGVPVALVDLNDIGGKILGKSAECPSDKVLLGILKDNPLGQSREQTPMGIIREITPEAD